MRKPHTIRRCPESLRAFPVQLELLERRDCPAVVMIDSGVQVSEADGFASLAVKLSAPTRQSVSVDYYLQGDATSGQDFRLSIGSTSLASPRGTITFRPGETLKTVTVRLTDDLLREGTESFSLNLFMPRNVALTRAKTATVTIRDNDDYTARLEGPSILEEGKAAEYSLVLSSPATKTETFYLNTSSGVATAGEDFRQLSQLPLVFKPGELAKRFTIHSVADERVEYDEYFLLRVTPTSPGFPVVAPYGVTISGIGPMPPPTLSISDVTANEGNQGLTAFVFTVRASTPFGSPISVNYATAEGTATTADQDFAATSGTLTIDPGSTTGTIRVEVRGDAKFEPDETFAVVLSSPVNATLDKATGVGTITNDDTDTATTFQITVRFPDNSLTATQKRVFEVAAARWSEIITGDLPDVTIAGRIIDDVEIEATAPRIDGSGGILGGAAPTAFRTTGSRLPYQGIMEFDSADVASMESNGTFTGVILHEMGHVLGIGSLWSDKSLVINRNTPDPLYIGVNGLREYRTLAATPSATGVPVEAGGGPGTALAHWRESVFRTELMTGYAERSGVRMPISRLSIGALEDLGYTVAYAAADPYTLPGSVTNSQSNASKPQPGGTSTRFLRSAAALNHAVFAVLGQERVAASTSPPKQRLFARNVASRPSMSP